MKKKDRCSGVSRVSVSSAGGRRAWRWVRSIPFFAAGVPRCKCEEERRNQLGLPSSQVPVIQTGQSVHRRQRSRNVQRPKTQRSSNEEPPHKSAKTSSTYEAISSAEMSKPRCTVYAGPHGTSVAVPPNTLRMKHDILHDILALTSHRHPCRHRWRADAPWLLYSDTGVRPARRRDRQRLPAAERLRAT